MCSQLNVFIAWQVSYYSARVLSEIASDGPKAWAIEEPSRESVLNALTDAMQKWDFTVEMNIRYR